MELTRTQISIWRSKFPRNPQKFAQFCFQQGRISAFEEILNYSFNRLTPSHHSGERVGCPSTPSYFSRPAGEHVQNLGLMCDSPCPHPEHRLLSDDGSGPGGKS